MRTTILIAVLGANGFAAAACTAQSTPQTAAQANTQILDQTTPAPAPAPMPMPPRGGRGEGRGGGGMMRADTNGDGIVTRAEAIAEADQRFARMDTDGDGQITAAEMQASRAMMQQRMEARGQDVPPPPPGGPKRTPGMGRGADPDGNGIITRAEFEARAGTRFDRMDANHDGKLDRTELANRSEMRRDRRGDMGDAPPPPPGE